MDWRKFKEKHKIHIGMEGSGNDCWIEEYNEVPLRKQFNVLQGFLTSHKLKGEVGLLWDDDNQVVDLCLLNLEFEGFRIISQGVCEHCGAEGYSEGVSSWLTITKLKKEKAEANTLGTEKELKL